MHTQHAPPLPPSPVPVPVPPLPGQDWDITLEDMGADTAKEQWGVENLSHHFLPLIRYRRAKARKQSGKFDAELVSGR